jgi:hypothetical protein
MWWNIEEFFWTLANYRVLNIRGRYGSGKTLLSVALAYELWKRHLVDTIYSNFPMAGRSEEYNKKENYVMIVDEPQEIFDSRDYMRNETKPWLRGLRKRKITVLLPGFSDIDVRFRKLVCQRMLLIGNFAWFYRWQIDDGIGITYGTFALLMPPKYFGAYDTKFLPGDEDYDNLRQLISAGENAKRKISTNGGGGTQYVEVHQEHTPNITFKAQVERPKFGRKRKK